MQTSAQRDKALCFDRARQVEWTRIGHHKEQNQRRKVRQSNLRRQAARVRGRRSAV